MNKDISYYKDLIKKHFFTFFITFFMVFSLALVYAYFAQKIYLSNAKVEILNYKQNNNSNNNQLQIAIKENSPEDESEILKSNSLIKKAIDSLNFSTEFFHYKGNKYFAIDEKDLPLSLDIFEIKNKQLYNQRITIIPLDNDQYELSFDTLKETYYYGELIENKNFKVLISKKLEDRIQ